MREPGYYAGIGSRRADEVAQRRAHLIAAKLASRGWTLRSGHAPGMDQAFEGGAGERAEVYLPWASFEARVPVLGEAIVGATDEAMAIAQVYHPAWYALRQGGRKLMGRNVHQVLGRDCKSPSEFVVCWTPNADVTGGTGQALRIAMDRGIEVYNLGHELGVSKMSQAFDVDLAYSVSLFGDS